MYCKYKTGISSRKQLKDLAKKYQDWTAFGEKKFRTHLLLLWCCPHFLTTPPLDSERQSTEENISSKSGFVGLESRRGSRCCRNAFLLLFTFIPGIAIACVSTSSGAYSAPQMVSRQWIIAHYIPETKDNHGYQVPHPVDHLLHPHFLHRRRLQKSEMLCLSISRSSWRLWVWWPCCVSTV